VADSYKDFDATLAPKAIVRRPHFTAMDVPATLRTEFLSGVSQSDFTNSFDAKLLVVDAKARVAWFHYVITMKYVEYPEFKESATFRVSGVAVDDHGWKLAALVWAHVLPDKDLFQRAQSRSRPDKTPPLELASARVVARWFDRGGSIAKDRATAAQTVANGTAPSEIGVGSAAAKLATSWDALGMWLWETESKEWGSVAFVAAKVGLPTKKHDNAVMLDLGAILVQEGGRWRWVSLDFAPPEYISNGS
jgi:hypothetical protein